MENITDRIKTFEDACKELGEFHPFVEQYNIFNKTSIKYLNKNNDIVAYLKLRIICAALNEGWEPRFTENEWRYYPWFYLYKDKNYKRIMNTDDYVTDYAGLVCAGVSFGPSHTSALIGSHLCLKSDKLAVYCGKQFIDIWADFVLIRR